MAMLRCQETLCACTHMHTLFKAKSAFNTFCWLEFVFIVCVFKNYVFAGLDGAVNNIFAKKKYTAWRPAL